jgi:porphobilinogen synthase
MTDISSTKNLQSLIEDSEPKSHADLLKSGKSLTSPAFPHVRMRRLRRTGALRDLVRESALSVNDLVYPLFVEEDLHEPQTVSSLPGVRRETEKTLEAAVKDAAASGLKAIVLFGVSHNKDAVGSDTMSPDGLLARMISRAKNAAPEMAVIADVCFCEYTDHGHCGPLSPDGDVDNDAALENIAIQAVTAAESGADIIAPSGMMDGQVSVIRHALDVTGFAHIPILAYAAKFASVFYGPFRDAAGCSLGHMKGVRKDRKTYQLDPANARQAVKDALLDLQEGADMLMVKPGLPYLDILKTLRDQCDAPLAAYQVSGEFAMLKYAAEAGALNYEEALMESLMAFKRAGADLILTYGAVDAARVS